MKSVSVWMLAVILALVCVGCDRGPAKPAASGKAEKPGSGASATAPAAAEQDSAADSVKELPQVDLEGIRKLVSGSAGRKEVVVFDFWATWCAPCVDLFPALHEGVEKMGPGVRLVSVTLDTPGELEAAAIAFLEKQHAVEGAYLLDPDTDKRMAVVDGLGKRWNNLVVPAILVFGPDGQLAHEFFDRDKVEDMLARIAALKAGGAAPATSPASP